VVDAGDLLAGALVDLPRRALGQPAVVHEDQGGAVLAHQAVEFVEEARPDALAGQLAVVVDRRGDGEVDLLAAA
jgi:hypothetical protein